MYWTEVTVQLLMASVSVSYPSLMHLRTPGPTPPFAPSEGVGAMLPDREA